MKKIWIGIDDTDSIKGGCTTYIACALIEKLGTESYDLIDYPNLVRLNPNIPWKTRGNGAISFQIGKGSGKKILIGSIGNKKIYCYSKGSTENISTKKIREHIEETINEHAKLDDEKTNSGFVLTKIKPSFATYKKTVKQIITLKETEKKLQKLKAEYKGYKNRRGLIGATASIAWSSKNDKTFELITYREKNKWGKKRIVDQNSTKKMDKKFPTTFDNYDYENRHNRLVPSSPCPVLFGIRGEKHKDLIDAKSLIKSEKISAWLIFKTNQGTDDHLQRKEIHNIKPYESAIVKAKIINKPFTIKGGHVIFKIQDSTGTIDCAAYEPTKQFRDVIRKLLIGDKVKVYGGVREKPLTINLEKIKIFHLEKQYEKIENPVCPKCGKHMKSKGKNQGFKCIKCGTKAKKPIIKEKNRILKKGLYEVPVCARRHLSKPLKRIER